jgi:hypothetical protein
MAEICEHFELKQSNPDNNRKLRELNGMTIQEAATKFEMTVTEFLEMLGTLEREGKLKVEIK